MVKTVELTFKLKICRNSSERFFTEGYNRSLLFKHINS